ncbi:hypothetical protein MRX96_010389 [Rhipicephalus microplus]
MELKFQAAQKQASEQSDDFGAGKGAVCVVCGERKDQPPPSRSFPRSRLPSRSLPRRSSSERPHRVFSLGQELPKQTGAPRCSRCRHRQHAETVLVEEAWPTATPQTRAERQRWRTLLGPRHAQDPQLSQAARRPGAGTMPRCYLVKKAATKHPAGPASSGRWPYREPLSPSEAETAPCAPLFGDQAADERPAIVTSAAFGRTSPTAAGEEAQVCFGGPECRRCACAYKEISYVRDQVSCVLCTSSCFPAPNGSGLSAGLHPGETLVSTGPLANPTRRRVEKGSPRGLLRK